MAVADVPRTIVNLSLQGLRLPLSTAERLTHHTWDEGSWPPAVAFERFESTTKRFWGTVLRDDELVAEGQRLQVHAGQVAEALRLEADAQQALAQADEQLAQRREAVRADRQRTEQQAEAREQKIERDRKRVEAKARADRRKRAESAAANKARRERQVDDREHDAAVTRNRARTTAVAARRRAVDAAGTVRELDGEIEIKKAQRKGA
jgi:hypothetical protein